MRVSVLEEIPTPVSHPSTGTSKKNADRLKVTSHGITDRGRRRGKNEDHYLIATLNHSLQVRESSVDQPAIQCGEPRGHLFVVADGMGGHSGGEQASALAVHSVETYVMDSLNWCARLRSDGNTLLSEFQKALQQADAEVAAESRAHPELRGMGTTLTLAYVVGNEIFVSHVGDSRCYLLRGQMLFRLTRDHTLVQEMVRRGILNEAEAATHNLRHVIANVVGGTDPGVEVELHKLAAEANDRLLLCSDGLTEMVTDQEIATIIESAATPEEACQALVNRANEQGGKDNITVVVAHFSK